MTPQTLDEQRLVALKFKICLPPFQCCILLVTHQDDLGATIAILRNSWLNEFVAKKKEKRVYRKNETVTKVLNYFEYDTLVNHIVAVSLTD